MDEFFFRVCRSTPEVKLLYVNHIHEPSNWHNVINVPKCIVNLFLDGYCYITVNGKPYAVSGGDVLIYRPNELHYGRLPYTQNIEYFEFHFEPETLSPLAGGDTLTEHFSLRPNDPSSVLLRPTAREFQDLTSIAQRLRSGFHSPPPLWESRAASLFVELLLAVHDCHRGEIPPAPEAYPVPLIAALNHIHQHLSQPMTNADVSEAAHITPSYLSRLFREHLGCSPHDYILSCRLDLAKNYLGSGKSVTEACFLSGFQDCSSFGSIFRRHMGMTPSEYRKCRK